MRKATSCLLLILCSVFAFGQNQPQWKVVQSVILRGQTAPILQTTIFTPQEPGLYRLTAYVSGIAQEGGGFTFYFGCTDETGATCWTSLGLGENGFTSLREFVFSPLPGTPVFYYTQFRELTNPKYNLVLTIEQLQ